MLKCLNVINFSFSAYLEKKAAEPPAAEEEVATLEAPSTGSLNDQETATEPDPKTEPAKPEGKGKKKKAP